MKGCLKQSSPVPTPGPSRSASAAGFGGGEGEDVGAHCRHLRRCVTFCEEGKFEVHLADEWDRTPTEPARRLSYRDVLELKEIQRSLPRANQIPDPLSSRPHSHILSNVPIGLLPLLAESPVAAPNPTTPPPTLSPQSPNSSYFPHISKPVPPPPAPTTNRNYLPHLPHLPPANLPPVRPRPRFAFLPLLPTSPTFESSPVTTPTSPTPSSASDITTNSSATASSQDPDLPTPDSETPPWFLSAHIQSNRRTDNPYFPNTHRDRDHSEDVIPHPPSPPYSLKGRLSALAAMELSPPSPLSLPPSRSIFRDPNMYIPPNPPSTHASVTHQRSGYGLGIGNIGGYGASNLSAVVPDVPKPSPKPGKKRNFIVVNDMEIELDDDDDEDDEEEEAAAAALPSPPPVAAVTPSPPVTTHIPGSITIPPSITSVSAASTTNLNNTPPTPTSIPSPPSIPIKSIVRLSLSSSPSPPSSSPPMYRTSPSSSSTTVNLHHSPIRLHRVPSPMNGRSQSPNLRLSMRTGGGGSGSGSSSGSTRSPVLVPSA